MIWDEGDPLPYNNPAKEGEDTGWIDPVKYAEERRKRLGIRREDYLYPTAWRTR